ncbi:hypothetical protein ATCV1_Z353R [Acanthocystis turfacea chlorella virus 1]|uniref:Uncharacterized protein Z353R n=1 Tax=Chlorovirus heliozoae TaxID=322019 RepID=A7K8W3_9PHYC|nr:hypothetical protein ATCV1_Z353R [Acanthocystis turfacea chlorella virus 1]ABT16487.1 hypothetical protein ATCV1_Z353R [Acanthocystis turfacea chlorella virus 1]
MLPLLCDLHIDLLLSHSFASRIQLLHELFHLVFSEELFRRGYDCLFLQSRSAGGRLLQDRRILCAYRVVLVFLHEFKYELAQFVLLAFYHGKVLLGA